MTNCETSTPNLRQQKSKNDNNKSSEHTADFNLNPACKESDRFVNFGINAKKIYGQDLNTKMLSENFKSIALNLSSSVDTAASSSFNTSASGGNNTSLLLRKNSFLDESFVESTSLNASQSFTTNDSAAVRDWRVVGEGSSAGHQQHQQQDRSSFPDDNFFPTINNFHSSQVLNTFSSALPRSTTAEIETTSGAAIPDVLKQVMDMQVKVHKSIAQNPDLRSSCTWKGNLSQKHFPNAFANTGNNINNNSGIDSEKKLYSRKVFAGGVPWEATESNIMNAFSNGSHQKRRIQIEYPSRPSSTTAFVSSNSNRNNEDSQMDTKNGRKLKAKPAKVSNNYFPGYVYLIFESSDSVNSIVEDCCRKANDSGKLFFEIEVGTHRNSSKKTAKQQNITSKKEVEFIPFAIEDAEWSMPNYENIHHNDFSENTAFVGALHGQITASMLAKIMTELFGQVVKVTLDLDKWKYPIGSGKIVFASRSFLCKALEAGIVDVVTERFKKRIQVDPFLHSSGCCMCHSSTQLTYFCRDNSCFAYFCKDCWFWRHNAPSGDFDSDQNLRTHIPLTR